MAPAKPATTAMYYSRYRRRERLWVVCETESKRIMARCQEKRDAKLIAELLNRHGGHT